MVDPDYYARIGYLGMPGSFSHLATAKFFPQGKLVGQKTTSAIIRLVEDEQLAYGVIPIENSVSGSVVKHYDQLLSTTLFITGEIYFPIREHLLTKKKISVAQIKTVYSHPEAFNQCDEFLRRLKVKRVATDDTASAACLVAGSKVESDAAIASQEAAKRFSLVILRRRIETNKKNVSRFIVIGRELNNLTASANKATVIFTLAHKPGTLHQVLGVLARKKLNLTKIESRPMLGRPFEYMFIVDFEFIKKSDLEGAIKEMEAVTINLRLLGIYQKGELYGG